MEGFLESLGQMILHYGVKILVALAIFVIGRWVAKKVRGILSRLMAQKGVDVAVVNFVSSLCYILILVFVVIAALSHLGLETTSFVAVLGAAGLAVGLALQGSLSNFASGVLILLFKPFRVGDFVEVAGTSGSVDKIQVLTTELNTPDNKKVIVPNSAVMGGTITNYSANDTRRVDMVMGISYSDDIDKAKAVLEDIVNSDERILKDPAVTIAVVELADSSVNFAVRPWVNKADYWGVYFDVTEAVKKRFDQEGISIPFPQQEVYMYQKDAE